MAGNNLIGKTLLGRYEVREHLGRGGMADVYKVWDEERGVFLAAKFMQESIAKTPAQRDPDMTALLDAYNAAMSTEPAPEPEPVAENIDVMAATPTQAGQPTPAPPNEASEVMNENSPPPPPKPPRKESWLQRLPAWVWVGIGVLIAMLAAAIVFFIMDGGFDDLFVTSSRSTASSRSKDKDKDKEEEEEEEEPTEIPTITPTPAPTPQGGGSGWIAFTSNRDGDLDIYVMDADGSNGGVALQLTDDDAVDGEAAWSPDGTQIVFHSTRGNGDSDIYVMDADGGNVVRLTDDDAGDAFPDWSPNGRQIVFFSDRDGDSDIYVMDADGSNLVQLTDDDAYDGLPAWSPDGRRIAFVSVRDGDVNIYLMDVDGRNVVQLTNNDAGESSYPAWSPDGNRIAYYFYEDEDADLYVMDADGGDVRQFTDSDGADWSPSWSPDGTQIVFASERDGGQTLYMIDANGGDAQRLTDNDWDDWAPSWQPVFSIDYESLVQATPISAASTSASETEEITLLAYYPLDGHGMEIMGEYGEMRMEGSASFRDGGAWCNGVYEHSGDSNWCNVETPQITGFNPESFSIYLEFKADEYKSGPVIVGGHGGQWIGFLLKADGSTALLYNNSNEEFCSFDYEVDEWHDVMITYGGWEALVYFDGELGCAAYYSLTTYGDDDLAFMVTNYSNGSVFSGVIRELQIYEGVIGD